jgi:WXG100 family type VII secretion target
VTVPSPSPTQVVDAYDKASEKWESVTSPRSSGVDAAMDWFLQPFVEPLLGLLELATGDPEQLDAHAATWQRAAAGIREQVAAERADLQRLVVDWHGEAAQAYAVRIQELADRLEQVAGEMARTADSLADSAEDLRNVAEMIKDIIRELVEFLIVTWVAAQAVAAITAGASNAALAVSWAARLGVDVSRTTMLLARLHEALKSYTAMLESLKALGTVGGFVAERIAPQALMELCLSATTGLNGSKWGVATEAAGGAVRLYVHAAADEAEDRLRGDDGDGSRMRRWVSSQTDPVVDTVREWAD